MYIHYFASIEDRKELFLKIEELFPIKYILCGNFLKSNVSLKSLVFNSFNEIELSENTNSKQLSTSNNYLVVFKDTEITINEFIDYENKKRFTINEGINPDSIEYTRSGIYENKVFIHGRFATFGKSEISKKIFGQVRKIVKKEFKMVKSFYLGPNAYNEFENGTRFACASVDSPKEYDLII